MISKQRLRANRENARKSTGPKSASGKNRSSRNALRHGLDALHVHDTLTNERIERLAAMICGDNAKPIEQELATTIAEYQVTLSRIRAARICAVERLRASGVPSYVLYVSNNLPEAMAENDAKRRSRSDPFPDATADYVDGNRRPRSDIESLQRALPQLLAIERYEKRALSKRRRAIDAFQYIRSARVSEN